MSDESKILAGRANSSSLTSPGTSNYPHPIIAREGWPFVAGSIAAALLVHWLAGLWWAAPLWFVVVFVVQFFRDPPRSVPLEPKAV